MTRFQTVFAKAGVAFAAAISLSQAVSASVVYENSGSHSNFSSTKAAEIGDQVTLAGTDRVVTQFKAEFFLDSFAGGESVTVRFYDIGLDNKPGNLLLTSQTTALSAAGFGTINVSGISVTVPDSFVWTVAFDGLNVGESAGLVLNSTPSIGSSDGTFFWVKDGGLFKSLSTGGGVSDNFAAQVTAVPEPGTWALLLTGVAGLTAFGYRRKA